MSTNHPRFPPARTIVDVQNAAARIELDEDKAGSLTMYLHNKPERPGLLIYGIDAITSGRGKAAQSLADNARNRFVRESYMQGYRAACMRREAACIHFISRRRAA